MIVCGILFVIGFGVVSESFVEVVVDFVYGDCEYGWDVFKFGFMNVVLMGVGGVWDCVVNVMVCVIGWLVVVCLVGGECILIDG